LKPVKDGEGGKGHKRKSVGQELGKRRKEEKMPSGSQEDDSSTAIADDTPYSSEEEVTMKTRIPRRKEYSIEIGPKHQVALPLQRSISSMPPSPASNPPTLVFSPNIISDEEVDDYLSQASTVLTEYMCSRNITPSETKSTLPRELDLDTLLHTLHLSEYSVSKALATVKESPTSHLTLWTPEEQNSFNIGFRRYCGTLRMIHKSVGDTKNHQDVVDYHYRFKIPDQYGKYQAIKKEQAKGMMDQASRRSQADSKHWSKSTATDKRHVQARDFLIRARETIGNEKYLSLANCLKTYHASGCSVSELKKQVLDLLNGNHHLLESFIYFLPEKFRT